LACPSATGSICRRGTTESERINYRRSFRESSRYDTPDNP
jgi:hypothetical protein